MQRNDNKEAYLKTIISKLKELEDLALSGAQGLLSVANMKRFKELTGVTGEVMTPLQQLFPILKNENSSNPDTYTEIFKKIDELIKDGDEIVEEALFSSQDLQANSWEDIKSNLEELKEELTILVFDEFANYQKVEQEEDSDSDESDLSSISNSEASDSQDEDEYSRSSKSSAGHPNSLFGKTSPSHSSGKYSAKQTQDSDSEKEQSLSSRKR